MNVFLNVTDAQRYVKRSQPYSTSMKSRRLCSEIRAKVVALGLFIACASGENDEFNFKGVEDDKPKSD